MKRGMPSGAQTPDGIIFLLALIFSKAPPRYPPHHGAHWAYTWQSQIQMGLAGRIRILASSRGGQQQFLRFLIKKIAYGWSDKGDYLQPRGEAQTNRKTKHLKNEFYNFGISCLLAFFPNHILDNDSYLEC